MSGKLGAIRFRVHSRAAFARSLQVLQKPPLPRARLMLGQGRIGDWMMKRRLSLRLPGRLRLAASRRRVVNVIYSRHALPIPVCVHIDDRITTVGTGRRRARNSAIVTVHGTVARVLTKRSIKP
jgi:hypothetical protein